MRKPGALANDLRLISGTHWGSTMTPRLRCVNAYAPAAKRSIGSSPLHMFAEPEQVSYRPDELKQVGVDITQPVAQ